MCQEKSPFQSQGEKAKPQLSGSTPWQPPFNLRSHCVTRKAGTGGRSVRSPLWGGKQWQHFFWGVGRGGSEGLRGFLGWREPSPMSPAALSALQRSSSRRALWLGCSPLSDHLQVGYSGLLLITVFSRNKVQNAQSLSQDLESREVTWEKRMPGSTGCLSFPGDNCPTSLLPTNALSTL